MDSKFYISYKAAKLLKEKGYNEECDCAIDEDSDIYVCEYRMNQDLPEWKWSCPTKAEAIDWLESKGIVIELQYENNGRQKYNSDWQYYIYRYYNEEWLDKTMSFWGMGRCYDTKLEAEEAAIIKALELL